MKRCSILYAAVLASITVHYCGAQGTAFTYQGRLNDGANPANDVYDFTFTIYDGPSGNGSFAIHSNWNTLVTNGVFTATIDLGTASEFIFTGPERWLEIAVRPSGSSTFTNLSPRQRITATPYAIMAQSASNLLGPLPPAPVTGSYSSAVSFNNASNSFTGSFAGNGAGVTNIAIGTLNAPGLFTWPGNFVLSSSPVVGTAPGSVAAADVNGDGKVDLISANQVDNTLSVLTNNGSGGFVLSSSPGVGSNPQSVAAADVNGDGKMDLISANAFANTLTVLTNNGSGAFALSSSPAVGGIPASVAAADVNGDGKMDLISANANDNTLTVLTNNGSGDFMLSSSPGVGSGPYSVAAADVNGDGKVDLISANFGALPPGNTLTVLTNNGAGGFVLASSPGVGSSPISVTAVDVNGDGKVDLISANDVANTLTVLTNNGSGDFALSSSPGVNGEATSVVAADVNGDGKVDLISANSDKLTVLTNNGSGGFALSSSPGVGHSAYSVVSADVNGDGKADLISADPVANRLSVLFNTPTFTGHFAGNGSGLTSLNASQLTSGTVPPAQIPNLDASKITTGILGIAQIPNLDASKITSGTLASAQIPNLDASKITSATLSDARLSANVALRAGGNAFTGNQTIAAGNVGIGTTSPGYPFDVQSGQAVARFTTSNSANGSVLELDNASSAVSYYGAINFNGGFGQIGYLTNNLMAFRTSGFERMRIEGSGNIGIGRAATANALEVEGNASKTFAGSWLANSDARIKTDVRTLTNALDKLAQVRLVQFRYTDEYRAQHPGIKDRSYLNVVAQEFQKVFPEHVQSSGEKLPGGDEAVLQVDHAFLVRAMRTTIEHAARFDAVSDDAATTMLARRGESVNRALETIKEVRFAFPDNFDRFVVIVSADFAIMSHMPLHLFPPAATYEQTRGWQQSAFNRVCCSNWSGPVAGGSRWPASSASRSNDLSRANPRRGRNESMGPAAILRWELVLLRVCPGANAC